MIDREAIMARARARIDRAEDDLVCQLVALIIAVEAQRDAGYRREGEERRIADAWAQRAKAAEERAVGAEAERRAFSARIDELEALLAAPRTPGAPWCETAMDRMRQEDRVRRENESAARSTREAG